MSQELLRTLGFNSSNGTDTAALVVDQKSGQKRPGDDGHLTVAMKRPMDGPQVSSTANNASSFSQSNFTSA